MTNALHKRWLLDAALLAGFLACFFLDWTGVQIHQILGGVGAVAATYHLVTHWQWVQSVFTRFFGKLSHQARLYFMIDALVAGGFFMILTTGVIISTWVNLSLSNYEAWRVLHVGVSITTLVALLAKIVVHARWIILVGKKILAGPVASPAPATASGFSRRDFLKVIGTVGVASLIAIQKAAVSLEPAASAANLAEVGSSAATNLPTPVEEKALIGEATAVSETSSGSSLGAVVDPTPSATAQATEAAVVTSDNRATASLPNTNGSSETTCSVRCNKGCSFPGRCRRYTDSDANGRCDLGECMS